MVDHASKSADAAAATSDKKAQPQVKLDMSQLKSSYCNVANVISTREEVVLNFGINQNWDMGQKAMDVELLHRVILSPYAAKRFSNMLTKLVREYESRHGALT